MRVVILGGPGAGKGTQAAKLCRRLEIPCISTGAIFLEAIAAQTALGKKAQPYFDRGELVPDPTTIDLIRDRLLQPDAANGWLLDGYPRTAFQAEELDFSLDELGQQLDFAIWLKVSESELMSRTIAKSQNRPQQSRPDDAPEIIERRIQLFNERTIPILDYYDYRDRLLTINGDRPSEEVHQEIWTKLQE